MGQRVQVLLNLKDNKGNTSMSLIHEQWGIGRILPNMILSYLGNLERVKIGYANSESFIDSFKKVFLDNKFDITDELTLPEKLKFVDITDLKNLKKVLWGLDNNNGYAVIQIEQDKEHDYEYSVTVGYILGDEELNYDYEQKKYIGEQPFERYVGVHEWIMRTWGDYNDSSRKISNQFFNGYKQLSKTWQYNHITGKPHAYKVSTRFRTYKPKQVACEV